MDPRRSSLLADGNLFYVLGVAPPDRFAEYEGVFRKIVASIQMTRGQAGEER